MRKNNLLLLLLMALIVMSCSKDETSMSIPQEGNAIEFGTYVGRDAKTRALSVETPALLASGGGFGVFAYYTGQNVYGDAIKPNFMYNQGVTSTDEGVNWTYNPVKYWPNNVDDKVSFFAYAPFGNTNINIPAVADFTAGDPTIAFTVNGTAIQQVDLLYADATENMKNRIKNGTSPNQIGINEKITFKFKHALARIGFNVEAMVDEVNGKETGDLDASPETGNGTIDENTKIVVTKVELIGNFYPSGTLNLNNTVANTPIWTPAAATARTFELTPTNNFVSATAYGETGYQTTGQLVTSATPKQKLNKADSYIMVIPQDFDGATHPKIKIKVTYDVITKDASLNTGQSKVTNVITSDEFAFNFEHGKAYTFNLHLGMTSVKFDVTVTPWNTTEPETVVNVPINTVKIEAPSNSYIVAPNSLGIYIPVSIANASMLGEQLDVADDFTAELIWTDNENKISPISNIKSISTIGTGPTGFLVVEPGAAEGNAVVAIKNESGKILWSWHIWVTNYNPAPIGNGQFMDRNLGAIGNTRGEVATKGFLYQWGRKDPFPGSNSVNSNDDLRVYNKDGSIVEISRELFWIGTRFDDSFANPTTYYAYASGLGTKDWIGPNILGNRDDDLWGRNSTKTVYDPCPPGWRVPLSNVLSGVISNSAWADYGRTNNASGGYYPAAGARLYNNSGRVEDVGEDGYYWSASVNGTQARGIYFNRTEARAVSNPRSDTYSVRCVKE